MTCVRLAGVMGLGLMTTLCRSFLMVLLLSTSASASPAFWSQEYAEPSAIPAVNTATTWGIQWNGTEPRAENADRLFSLASVKKILTAATALRTLGSEFRFPNDFSGSVDTTQKILFSPVIHVSGDPTWGHPSYGENLSTRVLKVVNELKKLGIKKVEGEIEVVSLRPGLDQFHRPAEWKNSWVKECYAAIPTSVTIYGNCAVLSINSVKSVKWATPGVSTKIENHLFASSQNTVQITPVLDAFGKVEKYVVSGGFVAPLSEALPVHDNQGWLKNLLITQLKAAGITYSVQEIHQPSLSMEPVTVDLSSRTLKEVLPPFLQESINLVADRLHLEAGDDFGTLATLIPDAREYASATFFDGSGLIAKNQITPRAFLLVLSALTTQSYFSDLYQGLAVSGERGTLQGRMRQTALKGRIYAKTGTLDGVTNLAGYWVKDDRQLEPFVIFTESDAPASTVRAQIDSEIAGFALKN